MRLALIAIVALGMLAITSSASAAVTIGADTSSNAGPTQSCLNAGGCTFANLAIPGRDVAAPFDGVIVRWRVQGGGGVGALTPRVIRQLPGGAFTGVGTGAAEVIVPGAERTVPTRLAVQQGDLFALDINATDNNEIRFIMVPGTQKGQWLPSLADGDPGRATSVGPNYALRYNADVEPDCDRDGFGDESQDSDLAGCKPKAALAGKVKVRSAGARFVVRTGITVGCGAFGPRCEGTVSIRRTVPGRLAGASKTPKKLGSSKLSIAPGGSQAVKVKLTRKASKALAEKGKLKATISVSLGNAGGPPAVASRSAKLKPPAPKRR